MYRGAAPGAALVGVTLAGAALVAGAGWTTLVGPWAGHPGWGHPTGVAGHLGGGWPHRDAQGTTLVALTLVGAALAGRPHEYTALAGLLALASFVTLLTDHLGVLYLGLELQALTGYTLVGYHRDRVTTTEAALKYLLVGAAVGGLLLVGCFQGYAQGGSLGVGDLRFDRPGGVAWVLGAVLFKVGAAPFHFWGPPVYESVEWPTLVALTSYGKLNLWALLGGPLTPLVGPGWATLAAAGVVSLGVGAVGGLFQTSVGGVLGYSAALNGGYLLTVVAATGGDGPGGFALWAYLVGYSVGVALLGWTLQVGYLRGEPTPVGTVLPLVVYYLVLNLAGLPVVPGFALKLSLLGGLVHLGVFVSGVVVVASVFGVYYYLEVATPLVLTPTPGGEPSRLAYTGGVTALAGAALAGWGSQTCSLIW